jgi:hypothetical protein
MKPRIDITAQNSFAIWESGCWRDKERIGRATLVCGPSGEKLDVIFDNNPATATFHYLFFAEIGQVIATAFIREVGQSKYQYDLALKRIDALTIEPIQGNPVARAKTEFLWKLKQMGGPNAGTLIHESYKPDRMGFNEDYLLLIKTAVQKAFTAQEEQKLFWGTPRTPRDQ